MRLIDESQAYPHDLWGSNNICGEQSYIITSVSIDATLQHLYKLYSPVPGN